MNLHNLVLGYPLYTGVNKSIWATPATGVRLEINSRNVAVVLHHFLSLTAHYSQKEIYRKKIRDKCAHSSSAVSQTQYMVIRFNGTGWFVHCRVIFSLIMAVGLSPYWRYDSYSTWYRKHPSSKMSYHWRQQYLMLPCNIITSGGILSDWSSCNLNQTLSILSWTITSLPFCVWCIYTTCMMKEALVNQNSTTTYNTFVKAGKTFDISQFNLIWSFVFAAVNV